jgi:hypothetical protein
MFFIVRILAGCTCGHPASEMDRAVPTCPSNHRTPHFSTTRKMQSPLRFFTDEESAALFEKIAQRYLGIGGDEFIERWESCKYDDKSEDTRFTCLVSMIPFTRQR